MENRTGILKHSPLTYVLASVRFASWPLMAKKIDEIHDQLREYFPLIHRIKVRKIGIDGQVSPKIDDESAPAAWMLMPSDRSSGVQFSPEQLLIITKKYTRYPDFAEQLKKALYVLVQHMRFLDVTNLGVRYVDHIKTPEKENIEDYIKTGWLPTNVIGMKKLGGAVSGNYELNDSKLRVRSISQPDALSVPEDLISVLAMIHDPSTKLKLETLKQGELLLDIDSLRIFNIPERMEKDAIMEQLFSLHKEANAFFRHESVCTDHAFKVWKGDIQT